MACAIRTDNGELLKIVPVRIDSDQLPVICLILSISLIILLWHNSAFGPPGEYILM